MWQELVTRLGLLKVKVAHSRSEEHLMLFKSKLEALADLAQDKMCLRIFLLYSEWGSTLVPRVHYSCTFKLSLYQVQTFASFPDLPL